MARAGLFIKRFIMVHKKIIGSIAIIILSLNSYGYAIFEQIVQDHFAGDDAPLPDERPNFFDNIPDDKKQCRTCDENKRDLLGKNYPDDPRYPNKTYLLDDEDFRPYQGGTLDMPFLDGR